LATSIGSQFHVSKEMVFFFSTQTYPPQGQKHTWNKKTSRHAQIKDSHEMRGNTKREG
jgi:hypothetical protein